MEAKNTIRYLKLLQAFQDGKSVEVIYIRPRFYIAFNRGSNTMNKKEQELVRDVERAWYYGGDNTRLSGTLSFLKMVIKPTNATKAYVRIDPAETKIYIPKYFSEAFPDQTTPGNKKYHPWLDWITTRKKLFMDHLVLIEEKE